MVIKPSKSKLTWSVLLLKCVPIPGCHQVICGDVSEQRCGLSAYLEKMSCQTFSTRVIEAGCAATVRMRGRQKWSQYGGANPILV